MLKKRIILIIALLLVDLAIIHGQTGSDDIIVPGNSLTEKLAWLQRSADSHNTYILVVSANENITPHKFEFRGAVNITVVLRGDNINRTIRLRSNDRMFEVCSDVILILDNNLTLQGHSQNTGHHLVNVLGGSFIMNSGSAITGNGGGGVWISSGIFTMNGGTISGNTRDYGAGVKLDGGTFTMNNGTINGNTASNGAGVYNSGNFTMRGGTITNNTAREYGGGVYSNGTFIKAGGIITGYNSDQSNGNAVKDDDGVLARRGHAVYVDEVRRIETTIGPDTRLNSNSSGVAGGWGN